MSPAPEAGDGAAAQPQPKPKSPTTTQSHQESHHPSPPRSKSPSPPNEPPPPPDPALDPSLSADADHATSPPLLSPQTEQRMLSDLDDDIFRIPPSAAMSLLGAAVEAFVRLTGDIPPSPAPEHPEVPHMRGMEAEKQNIVRSHSERTLVRLRLEAEAAAGRASRAETPSTSNTQGIDGVRLRQSLQRNTHSSGSGSSTATTGTLNRAVPRPPPPPSTPEPYTVVGANQQPVNVQHSAITRKFYSRKPPPISISDYLTRLHRYCPASTAVYLATSLYLHRLAVEERAIAVTRRNAHRLLLAGLRVAMKALEDRCYPHRRVAQVGGVSCEELARLEISFCFLAGFELVAGPEELRRHWMVMRSPPEPLLSPTLYSGGGGGQEEDDGGLELNLAKRPRVGSEEN